MNPIAPRFRLIGGAFTVLAVVIVFQIVRMQFSADAQAIKNDVENAGYYTQQMEPVRGSIYDRHGNLLAGNQTVYEIGIDPQYIPDDKMEIFVAAVVEYLPDLDLSTISSGGGSKMDVLASTLTKLKKIQEESKKNHSKENRYMNFVLDQYATPEQAGKLFTRALELEEEAHGTDYHMEERLDMDIPDPQAYWVQRLHPLGLNFRRHYNRIYPENSLASNVIGFVSRDPNADMQGVEGKYDRILAGNMKQVNIPRNPNEAAKSPSNPEGVSLVLTLDREIQANVETIVDDTLKNTEADSVTIIVMDPRSGEILAMAVDKRMNLNHLEEYAKTFQQPNQYNRAVTMHYEPGSVFKVLTMAAGLDSGTVKPEDTYQDMGVYEIGDAKYYNWDRAAHGVVNMTQCMQLSLNVCLSYVADKMGKDSFYGYMKKFGIGRYTGVDLAFEAPGRMKLPGDADWTRSELGSNSFGQGVDVTPIQMLMGASAVANDGKMCMPHVVKAMIENGRQHDVPAQIVSTPISAATARRLTQMLTESLENGEGQDVLIPGYRVAGKTGTGQIPIPEENRYDDQYTNASFVGWGPSDDPRFIVYVWVEKPKTDTWGSTIAAPVFRQVVEKLVVLMDLPPDDQRLALSNAAAGQPALPENPAPAGQ